MKPTTDHDALARRALFGALVLMVGGLVFWSKAAVMHLAFFRSAVASGELYRLISYPFVHRSWGEACWGLAAAGAIGLMLGRQRSAWGWAGLALTSTLFAAVGVYWIELRIEMLWGLSAPLFGVFVAGLLSSWQAGERTAVKNFAGLLVIYFVGQVFIGSSFFSTPRGLRLNTLWLADLLGVAGGLTWAAGESWWRSRASSGIGPWSG